MTEEEGDSTAEGQPLASFPVKRAYRNPGGRISDLRNLEVFIEQIHRCYEQSTVPGSKGWPSLNDYSNAKSAIEFLDPRKATRRNVKPRWKLLVASVDNSYPELLLRYNLRRYFIYALDVLSSLEKIPDSTSEFLISANKLIAGSVPDEVSEKVLAGEKAFSIYKGEAVSGEWADRILDLCPASFRRLKPDLLKEGKSIPCEYRRLVEYSAALEVVRVHREFVRNHWRWVQPLLQFIDWTGYCETHQSYRLAVLLDLIRIESETEREETRRRNRERKRKSRELSRGKLDKET